MDDHYPLLMTRRHFFGRQATGIGSAALAALLAGKLNAAPRTESLGLPDLPHFAPTAKRVIFLFMSGGPSQMELFDYKPGLEKRRGEELPASIRMGQRLTGMTSTQDSFPVVESRYRFQQHGQSGAWVSELMPHTAGIVDDLCFLKSMQTEAINHDPAITFFQTGAQLAGRPSIGAWVTYGLGSESEDLPGFVVLITKGGGDQPIYDRLPGREVSLDGRPGPESVESCGLRRRKAEDLSRRAAEAEPDQAQCVRRPGNQHPHRAV
jgi:hypothetical protein